MSNFIFNFWYGRISLWKAYWLIGELTNSLVIILIYNIEIRSLNNIGLYVDPPKASLYIWAEVPEGYSSKDFSEQLLEECNVLVSPGTSYGKYGEGFVRLSLTLSDDKIDEALTRIAKWKQ